jgi:hypothetical protein
MSADADQVVDEAQRAGHLRTPSRGMSATGCDRPPTP